MEWIVLIFGVAALLVYEYATSQSCSEPAKAGGPTPCGVCYQPVGGSDGTSGGDLSCEITNDRSTWPTGDRVWDVCRAIAVAEGADHAGSAPDRYNNPGDLSKGDEHGQAIVDYVNLPDGETLIEFETKTGGWQALYTKVNNIRLGISRTYSPSMSWNQVAAKYAGNSGAWVANVTRELGVSPGDSFGSYFA